MSKKLEKYTESWCCKDAALVIFWHPEEKKYGPERTGWTMYTNETFRMNVNYCPFCGIKLSKLTETKPS